MFQAKSLNTAAPTDKQLAVELQMNVTLSRGLLDCTRVVVHMEGGFFHVALGLHSVPALVVQGCRRLDPHLKWPVSHIEGEDHFIWGWKTKRNLFFYTIKPCLTIFIETHIVQMS